MKLFFKKAKSAANRITCHPTAPYLMRSHFISSALGGHQFSATNRGIRAKFQRLETIVSVITETFWASPRQDPIIPVRGCQPTVLSDFLYSHALVSMKRIIVMSTDCGPGPMR